MKKSNQLFYLLAMLILFTGVGCKKEQSTPVDTTAKIDTRLVGTWLWAVNPLGISFDANGNYNGPDHGTACAYVIKKDGTGNCYSHAYVDQAGYAVSLNTTGIFETDNSGHLNYYPTAGTYTDSKGSKRSLTPDELYDPKTKQGAGILYRLLKFQGSDSFQVTTEDDSVITFYRITNW